MSQEQDLGWLDLVPNGWSTGHLRWLTRRFSGGTPNKDNEKYWADGAIPWLNSGAVNQFTVTEPSAYITDEAYQNSSAKWIPEGALVMALAGQGKTARDPCEMKTAWFVAEALHKETNAPLQDLFAMPSPSTSNIERSTPDADEE